MEYADESQQEKYTHEIFIRTAHLDPIYIVWAMTTMKYMHVQRYWEPHFHCSLRNYYFRLIPFLMGLRFIRLTFQKNTDCIVQTAETYYHFDFPDILIWLRFFRRLYQFYNITNIIVFFSQMST